MFTRIYNYYLFLICLQYFINYKYGIICINVFILLLLLAIKHLCEIKFWGRQNSVTGLFEKRC